MNRMAPTKGDPSHYEQAPLSPQQLDFHRSSFAKYLAEITYFDGQVGEIAQMLDSLDLVQNTLLMVASEQGSSFPFGKWTCYEMGVASGLVASWPGIIEPGVRSDAILNMSTSFHLFLMRGVSKTHDFDGRSFLPVLQGKSREHKNFAYSIQTTLGVNGVDQPYGIRSVVNRTLPLYPELVPRERIQHSRFQKPSIGGSRLGARRTGFCQPFLKRPGVELFDISKDPYCRTNLASDPTFRKQRQTLATALDDWMTQQLDLGRQAELEAGSRHNRWKTAQLKAEKSQT